MLSDLSFRLKLSYEAFSQYPLDINDNHPISDLIISYKYLEPFFNLDKPKLMNFFYLNKEKIHHLLYVSEETIKINENYFKKTFSDYFYLVLLIEHKEELINYEYKFEIIDDLIKQKSKGKFYDLLVMKILGKLIDNFNSIEDNEMDSEELDKLKDEFKQKRNENIQSAISELQKYNSNDNLDEEKINDLKLNDLYSVLIINILLKSGKLKEDEIENIIDEMDLKNINLTESMLNGINEFFKDENEIEKYKITNNFEINDEKINFYYNLFFYILKDSFYVYKITFLNDLRNEIKKNLNSFPNVDKNTKLKYIIDFITDTKYYSDKYNHSTQSKDESSSVQTKVGISPNTNADYSVSINQKDEDSDNSYEKREIKHSDLKLNNYYSILDIKNHIKNQIETKNKEVREIEKEYYLVINNKNEIEIYDKDFKFILGELGNVSDKKEEKEKEKRCEIQREVPKNISKNNISFELCRNNDICSYIVDLEKNMIYENRKFQLDIRLNRYFKVNNSTNEYIILAEDGAYQLNLPIEEKTIIPFVDLKKISSYIKINDKFYSFTTNVNYNNGENALYIYDVRNKKITNKIKGYYFTKCYNGLYLINVNESYKILLCACQSDTKMNENGILIQKIKGFEVNLPKEDFVNTDDFEVTCFCCLKREPNYQFILVGGFENDKRRGMIKLYKVSFDRNDQEQKVEINYIQDAIEEDEDSTLENSGSFEDFDGIINKIMISEINNREIIVSCLHGSIYRLSLPVDDNYFNYY